MDGRDPSSLMAPAVDPHNLQARNGAADRSIRVNAGPGRRPARTVSEQVRPTSSGSAASHRGGSNDSSTGEALGVRVRGSVSRSEGILAKIGDWVEGATSAGVGARTRPACGGGSNGGGKSGSGKRGSAGGSSRSSGRPLFGPADFTSATEDPDKRRLHAERGGQQQQLQQHYKRRTLEEQWRRECLAAIASRDLSEVQDSRLAYYAPGVVHRDGCAVVVVVGGHYRTGLVDREDLLLHCVAEMEKVGARPFVVLYFNASAPLSLLPDTVFFTELHAALHPQHRQLLHAIYCVHPGALFRSWAFVLRLQDPAVYSKIVYVDRVHDLISYFHPDVLHELPDLVRDKDLRVARGAAAAAPARR